MFSFPLLFFFVLGAIVGSFLNVLTLRYGTGRSLSGRSRCSSCERKLVWYELIPIFSFFVLRGRCQTCSSHISWQYPLVEGLTALVFLFTALTLHSGTLHSLLMTLYFSLIFSVLIAIAVYDIHHKIIPDAFVFSFVTLAFILAIFRFIYEEANQALYLNLLAGPFLFLPFFLIWIFSSGRLMGLGDGKFALGIGWLLGMSLGASAIIVGFWLGAFVGLGLVLFGRLNRYLSSLTMKSEIPFAPFLIAGTLIVFFSGINLFALQW